MPLHRCLQELWGCPAIFGFRDDTFQHLALMIDGPPKGVRRPVGLYADLVQVPLPVAMGAQRFHAFPPDLGSEHRTDPFHQYRMVLWQTWMQRLWKRPSTVGGHHGVSVAQRIRNDIPMDWDDQARLFEIG